MVENVDGSLLVVLWDVDGTLLRNGVNAGGLYGEAIELAAGRPLEHPVPRVHGKTDGQILWDALEANGLPRELHTAASAELDRLSLERHLGGSRREIAPGIVRAVTEFAARGFVNALLTGNSANRTRYKMEGAGLDAAAFAWDRSYFGDLAPVRSDLTLRAAADHAGHRLVVIGDTPADGIGASAAGIPFVGVATGAFTAGELRATEAVLVVDDLEAGLQPVLDYLDTLHAEGASADTPPVDSRAE
jgi:phosphoglycolate phosphatase